MSSVSRSVYQKLAEENKRLKKDLETIVMSEGVEWSKCITKWRNHFKQEREFMSIMKKVAKEYTKNNPKEFPWLKNESNKQ